MKCSPLGMFDSGGSRSDGPEFGTKRTVETGATNGFWRDDRGIGIGTESSQTVVRRVIDILAYVW